MTTTIVSDTWSKKNQQYLASCVEQVKETLSRYAMRAGGQNADMTISAEPSSWDSSTSLPAIDYLCKMFGLSKFERAVLVLCAAIELDTQVSQLCAKAHGNPGIAYPTFSLALAAFPDAHWSALAPTSPLRRFKLIDIYGFPQVPITKCQLQIEERILHYLTGISYLDEALRGMIEQVRIDAAPIADSQKKAADFICNAWKSGKPGHFNLFGSDETSKMTVAGWACRQLGLTLWHMPGELVPGKPDEMESLTQMWTRESVLLNAALYISASEVEPAMQKSVRRFASSIAGLVFLSTAEPWSASVTSTTSNNNSFMFSLEVSKPTKREQGTLWRSLLEKAAAPASAGELDKEIWKVVNQFNLNTLSIQSAAVEAMVAASSGENLSSSLWSSTLKVARPRLAELAQRIVAKATMDDLILPDRERKLLRSIITNVRQRYQVYELWGFGNAGERGLGITALFSGTSGTGKTMAAEVIANELKLDLFKIDLSMVVSKYIGETEKNLKRIFDAAEDGGTILFFDEADALFGKRSEVRDSHDRYANIEVGYLLQRMESYRGLAVLTTNMKDALDKAFLRRIRFVVNFPFPDEKSRRDIWKRVFPLSVPIDGLDFEHLAQLDITGGHIRNIALGASFMAAEEGMSVNMNHVRRTAQEEYDKMERPMPNIGGWRS